MSVPSLLSICTDYLVENLHKIDPTPTDLRVNEDRRSLLVSRLPEELVDLIFNKLEDNIYNFAYQFQGHLYSDCFVNSSLDTERVKLLPASLTSISIQMGHVYSIETLNQLSRRCSNLSRLYLCAEGREDLTGVHFPNLKMLTLNYICMKVKGILDLNPQIDCLKLLSHNFNANSVCTLQNIKHLSMSTNVFQLYPTLKDLLPKLESLQLRFLDTNVRDLLPSIAAATGHLKYLHLYSPSKNVSFVFDLEGFFIKNPGLQHLSISLDTSIRFNTAGLANLTSIYIHASNAMSYAASFTQVPNSFFADNSPGSILLPTCFWEGSPLKEGSPKR